jgi:hypothetical protein
MLPFEPVGVFTDNAFFTVSALRENSGRTELFVNVYTSLLAFLLQQ